MPHGVSMIASGMVAEHAKVASSPMRVARKCGTTAVLVMAKVEKMAANRCTLHLPLMSPAPFFVGVDYAYGLQEGVNDGGAHKLHSPFLQVGGNAV